MYKTVPLNSHSTYTPFVANSKHLESGHVNWKFIYNI